LSNDSPVPSSFSPHLEPDGPTAPVIRPRFQNRVWLHATLFVVTVITATLAGAEHYAGFASEFGRREVVLDRTLILNGLWYSGTFLGILLAHEMGHYLYCRRYDIDASLPYFLPLPPFIFLTGTLGAVIRIREPFRTKRELFDVGIAGPIGGLIVLLPALYYGLTLSPVVAAPTEGLIMYLGEPLLFQWAAHLVVGPVADGYTINMHPMVFACWFGMFATALNLLPFGQLDGGHITYAVFGERARWISAAAALTAGGLIFLSIAWIFPALMMAVMWRLVGLRHPPTMNPYEPLSPGRKTFALVALIAFIVCFTPTLLRIEDLVRRP
jgi:membrane-associated protease RseP (regulator of RpoE activity)